LVKILEANNKQNIAHLQVEGFFATVFIGKVSEKLQSELRWNQAVGFG